ncbi:MAG: PadR family transcriptional regulator [Lachnospiraceae bacterium]|nr:PadR family transcriptional regulator [Lachnospiraceae bacterium]
MAREQFQTLTEPMYYILLALMEECCGVDIMAKVLELSHGRVKVGPGTLYAMLSKFEDNEIIRKTDQQGRKKWYVITNEGKNMLQNEYARLRQMQEDGKRWLDT